MVKRQHLYGPPGCSLARLSRSSSTTFLHCRRRRSSAVRLARLRTVQSPDRLTRRMSSGESAAATLADRGLDPKCAFWARRPTQHGHTTKAARADRHWSMTRSVAGPQACSATPISNEEEEDDDDDEDDDEEDDDDDEEEEAEEEEQELEGQEEEELEEELEVVVAAAASTSVDFRFPWSSIFSTRATVRARSAAGVRSSRSRALAIRQLSMSVISTATRPPSTAAIGSPTYPLDAAKSTTWTGRVDPLGVLPPAPPPLLLLPGSPGAPAPAPAPAPGPGPAPLPLSRNSTSHSTGPSRFSICRRLRQDLTTVRPPADGSQPRGKAAQSQRRRLVMLCGGGAAVTRGVALRRASCHAGGGGGGRALRRRYSWRCRPNWAFRGSFEKVALLFFFFVAIAVTRREHLLEKTRTDTET